MNFIVNFKRYDALCKKATIQTGSVQAKQLI